MILARQAPQRGFAMPRPGDGESGDRDSAAPEVPEAPGGGHAAVSPAPDRLASDLPPLAPGAVVDLDAEQRSLRIGEILDRLDAEFVGLAPVKTRVREIAALLLVDRLRQRYGLTSSRPSLHMCFTGSPGTGKTTIASQMGVLLAELGYLRKGQLVSVTRDDLVGQYVGHTAPKTKEVLKRAMGGVLFIDEAYYLYRPENERDYGQESIEILLQFMESHREDLVVILAGYADRMDTFFRSNPGMASRIAHHLDFPDFTLDELVRIADLMLDREEYRLSAAAREAFREYVALRMTQPRFANARSMRNAIDRLRLRQAGRIVAAGGSIRVADLVEISAEDVRASRVFGTGNDAVAGHGPEPAEPDSELGLQLVSRDRTGSGRQDQAHRGAAARRGDDLQPPAEQLGPLAHPGQAEAARSGLAGRRRASGGEVESGAVIGHLEHDAAWRRGQPDPDRLSPGVLRHVLQRFLRGPVHGGLEVLGNLLPGRFHLHVKLGKRTAEAGQARGQAEIVEYRRTQPGDREPGLVKRCGGEFLGPGYLLGGQPRRAVDRVGGGGQVEEQADDALADPVVDLAGQPAALVFLPFHGLLSEPLQCFLALGQPLVQAGILDRAGDQPGHRPQQVHVGCREVPAQPGVHVEHADEVPKRRDHGDRDHRRVILAAQGRNVAVAGIAVLVTDDHGRLAVVGDPAGHAFAHRQLDLAD